MGAAGLAKALANNRTLRILGMRGNMIGDAGASALAGGLCVPGSTLVGLSLGKNHISDSGATALAGMLKVNSSLEELQLDENEIGDAGGCALAEAIENNRTLSTLWATKNSFGTATIARFTVAPRKGGSLRQLCVSTTQKQKQEAESAIKQAYHACREGGARDSRTLEGRPQQGEDPPRDHDSRCGPTPAEDEKNIPPIVPELRKQRPEGSSRAEGSWTIGAPPMQKSGVGGADAPSGGVIPLEVSPSEADGGRSVVRPEHNAYGRFGLTPVSCASTKQADCHSRLTTI
jgi:hypothetical protein